ncbi:MAG TPA: hydrogenase accessory protein HypB [candidate division WOR-3 bacterium]|uniref:Hydrogenase accessory protein HypB n=1 Tax=candidate division WOR-3 bacterium TaxID=2052148 RepID=A0A7C0ZJ13_UNCW3|nr:hydrogenase accessory protein HypB [candidate division WOR-3 bacterium]
MKKIKTLKSVFAANDQVADELRKELKEKGITFINIMGSPGSGKTSLIEKTMDELKDKKFAIIEGDIETSIDAEKLQKKGVEIYQINTGPFGGDCHLEAAWIKTAIEEMNLKGVDFLLVENIGNLVCPAEFDTGAHINVVILSVTEGEDKPPKYPLMFRRSQVLVISKTDLLPYMDVSLENIVKNARKINKDILVFPLSVKTGEGVAKWMNYIKNL